MLSNTVTQNSVCARQWADGQKLSITSSSSYFAVLLKLSIKIRCFNSNIKLPVYVNLRERTNGTNIVINCNNLDLQNVFVNNVFKYKMIKNFLRRSFLTISWQRCCWRCQTFRAERYCTYMYSSFSRLCSSAF